MRFFKILWTLSVTLALLGKINFAVANTAEDAEKFFNWAENSYPSIFPGHSATQSVLPWLFRFYSATGIYAGVNTDDQNVYVLGGLFGHESPTFIDTQHNLLVMAHGADTAADCFIPMGQSCDQWVHHYHTTYDDGTSVESAITMEVLGPAIFNGEQVTKLLQTTEVTQILSGNAPGAPVIQAEHFWSDGSSLVRYNHGTTQSLDNGSSILTYSPPLPWRYDLSSGEQYKHAFTATTSHGNATNEQSVEISVRYLGRDTVTTPAGTFKACVFEREQTPGNLKMTVWHAVGGLGLVKQTGTNPVEIALLSATLNGTPLVGH